MNAELSDDKKFRQHEKRVSNKLRIKSRVFDASLLGKYENETPLECALMLHFQAIVSVVYANLPEKDPEGNDRLNVAMAMAGTFKKKLRKKFEKGVAVRAAALEISDDMYMGFHISGAASHLMDLEDVTDWLNKADKAANATPHRPVLNTPKNRRGLTPSQMKKISDVFLEKGHQAGISRIADIFYKEGIRAGWASALVPEEFWLARWKEEE